MKTVVLGAYGFTGELVCKVLAEKNIPYSVAGRKLEILEELKDRYAVLGDLHLLEMKDQDSIAQLVDDYDVFINCVGPFSETASLLLESLTKKKKMYVDLTGEIEFVHNSREKYHETALKNKTTLVHSCAFESVFVNLMMHRLIEDPKQVRSIKAFYKTAKSKASPGTKLTMKLAKFRNDFHYLGGKVVKVRDVEMLEFQRDGDDLVVATPFALPEICFSKWDTSAENIGTYMLMDQHDASYVRKNVPNTDLVEKTALLAKFDKRRPPGPKAELRANQEFTIEVRVEDADGVKKVSKLEGKDYYLLSAQIAVYFIEKYIKREDKAHGVISPFSFLGKEHTFFEDFKMMPDEK